MVNIDQMKKFIENMKAIQELITKESKRMDNEFKIIMLKIKLGINDNIKIIDDNNNYAVSDNGDVYNLNFGKKLKPFVVGKPDKQYYAVSLYNDGIVTRLKNHRLVALAFIYNDQPEFKTMVDHKDGNKLNNNVSNLRWSTSSQNSQNMSKPQNTSSRWKGVHWNKHKEKWQARITYDGTLKHLGYFHNEAEAARKYDEHAKEKFGEFAKLNDI